MGLNLIGASKLILFDIDWNPANDIQVRINITKGAVICILDTLHTKALFFITWKYRSIYPRGGGGVGQETSWY